MPIFKVIGDMDFELQVDADTVERAEELAVEHLRVTLSTNGVKSEDEYMEVLDSNVIEDSFETELDED